MQISPKSFRYPLLLLALAVWYCREAFFYGRVLFPLGGDHVHSIFGSMVFFRDSVRQGDFPLWNPLVLCGHPFGITSITAFNLYHLAAIFLDAGSAYNAVTFASIFFGGLFLYLFITRNGLSPFAAWVSIAAWMITTSRDIDTGFFLLPLAFYLADLFLENKKNRLAYLGWVVTMAFYALNANTQYFIYGALFLLAYMLWKESRRGRLSPRIFFAIFLGFVIGAGLTLFYYVHLFTLTVASTRAAWDEIGVLLPTHLLKAVFPKLFYSPTRPELLVIFPRVLQWLFASVEPLKKIQMFLAPPYTGIAQAIGGVVCVFYTRREKEPFTQFFLMAIATAFLYLMLHPLIYMVVVKHIPVLKGMTGVVRLFNLYRFSLVVLGAKSIDLLLSRSQTSLQTFRWAEKVFAGVCFFLFSGMLASKFILVRYKDVLEAKVLSALGAAQKTSIFIQDRARFESERVEQFFYFFREASSFHNSYVWGPVALLVIFFGTARLYQKGKFSRAFFMGLLSAFVIFDVGSVMGYSLWATDREKTVQYSRLAEAIKRDPGLYRVFTIEDKTRSIHKMFLRPQSNLVYGITTPDGYGEFFQKRYVKFYSWLSKREHVPGPLHFMDDFDKSFADFVNCKYVVTTAANPKLEGDAGFEKIYEDADNRIFKNKAAMPRAFIVHQARTLPGAVEVETYLRERPERLKHEVILEGESREPLAPAPVAGLPETESAVFTEYRPNRLRMDLHLSGEGYVVMSESFMEGWKAALDGRPVPIERADYIFRAVRVGAGHHTLEMRFFPKPLWIGIMLSLGALVLLFIVLVFLL